MIFRNNGQRDHLGMQKGRGARQERARKWDLPEIHMESLKTRGHHNPEIGELVREGIIQLSDPEQRYIQRLSILLVGISIMIVPLPTGQTRLISLTNRTVILLSRYSCHSRYTMGILSPLGSYL